MLIIKQLTELKSTSKTCALNPLEILGGCEEQYGTLWDLVVNISALNCLTWISLKAGLPEVAVISVPIFGVNAAVKKFVVGSCDWADGLSHLCGFPFWNRALIKRGTGCEILGQVVLASFKFIFTCPLMMNLRISDSFKKHSLQPH